MYDKYIGNCQVLQPGSGSPVPQFYSARNVCHHYWVKAKIHVKTCEVYFFQSN